ncbi:MAG TPA: hypothetical protein VK540_15260 [Polyangiaceae bacterium]|nr:hypothetical protein [Polyangiaceae bacterium]
MLQKSSSGDERASEAGEAAPADQRVRAAWHAWLCALASDPEAAFAAALAYEALDGTGRDLWLDALDQDAPHIEVPKLAMYAPLLSVETEPLRRERIRSAVGDSGLTRRRPAGRALRGVAADGDRVVAVVLPLYLDFVHVLACRMRPHDGFVWVRRDPIVHDRDAPKMRSELEGVMLERTPLKPVVEELAHAVLAHRRSGRELPEALRVFVDLFQPGFDDEPGTDDEGKPE